MSIQNTDQQIIIPFLPAQRLEDNECGWHKKEVDTESKSYEIFFPTAAKHNMPPLTHIICTVYSQYSLSLILEVKVESCR